MRQYVKKLYEESIVFALLIASLAVGLSTWMLYYGINEYILVLSGSDLDFYVPGTYYLIFSPLVAPISGLIGGIIAFTKIRQKSKLPVSIVLASISVVATFAIKYILLMFFTLFLVIPFFELFTLAFICYSGIWLIPKYIIKYASERVSTANIEEPSGTEIITMYVSPILLVILLIIASHTLIIRLLDINPYINIDKYIIIITVFLLLLPRHGVYNAFFWVGVGLMITNVIETAIFLILMHLNIDFQDSNAFTILCGAINILFALPTVIYLSRRFRVSMPNAQSNS